MLHIHSLFVYLVFLVILQSIRQFRQVPKVYYEVLDRFAHQKIRKLIVSMPPQHGKALQIDTPILTTKGWKRHGDLKVGDYVFGEDGKPKRVEWISGNYLWHTMNVDFADGFSLIAAHEHEWELWCDHDDHKGRQIS